MQKIISNLSEINCIQSDTVSKKSFTGNINWEEQARSQVEPFFFDVNEPEDGEELELTLVLILNKHK